MIEIIIRVLCVLGGIAAWILIEAYTEDPEDRHFRYKNPKGGRL